MMMGIILQAITIVVGAILLLNTISGLAQKKMTEPICLTWGVIAVMIILGGCLLRPSELNKYISPRGLVLVLLVGFSVLWGAYSMSRVISDLMRKNNELAVMVSLMNQEIEELREKCEVRK